MTQSNQRDVWVAGVGMVPFTKPGTNDPYDQMARTATHAALGYAGLHYDQIDQAYAGYVYGDLTSGRTRRHRGSPPFAVHRGPAGRRFIDVITQSPTP